MHFVAFVGVDVAGNVDQRGVVILVDADAIACCSIRIGFDNNVAVDGKLVGGLNDNVTGIDGSAIILFYQVRARGIDNAAAANSNLCVFFFYYLSIFEVVGIFVGDGQVIAFDVYGSTGAGSYCGNVAVIAVVSAFTLIKALLRALIAFVLALNSAFSA